MDVYLVWSEKTKRIPERVLSIFGTGIVIGRVNSYASTMPSFVKFLRVTSGVKKGNKL